LYLLVNQGSPRGRLVKKKIRPRTEHSQRHRLVASRVHGSWRTSGGARRHDLKIMDGGISRLQR